MIAAAQLAAALHNINHTIIVYRRMYNCTISIIHMTYTIFVHAYTHTHAHVHIHTGRHTQLAAALQNAKVGEGLVCALKNAHEAGYISFVCVCTYVQIGGA